jgi:hypothetical protein
MNSGLGYKSPSLLPSKGECCDKSKSKRVGGFKEKRKREELEKRSETTLWLCPSTLLKICSTPTYAALLLYYKRIVISNLSELGPLLLSHI